MIIRKHHQFFRQSSQAGFTLIESLLAIIIVSILLVGLSPIIVLSVATRVQARRIELGTQAAKTYIDAVKSGTIGDTTKGAILPLPPITTTNPSSVPAPTSGGSLTACKDRTNCTSPNPASYFLYCVAGNPGRDCSTSSVTDMVVQAYAYQPNPAAPNPDPTKGYVLGVRVYRADAFKETGQLKAANTIDPNTGKPYKSQTFTGGLGPRDIPIVEITTDITSDTTTYINYCDRLKQANSANPANPASNCQ